MDRVRANKNTIDGPKVNEGIMNRIRANENIIDSTRAISISWIIPERMKSIMDGARKKRNHGWYQSNKGI